jgi:hypothetical protein
MHDSFAALLQQPTALRYKRTRAQWLSIRKPQPLALEFAALARLIEQNDLTAALRLYESLQSMGVLTLKWHRLGGEIARLTGEVRRAELHRFAYDALSQAILSTGKGMRNRPYIIADRSDAAELLYALGKSTQSHSLVQDAGRFFDVLLDENEHEYWFEITDLLTETVEIKAVLPQKTNRRKPLKSSGRKKASTGKRVSRPIALRGRR